MRTALALALGLALLATPVVAQQTDDLTDLFDSVATLWRYGDAVGLAAHGAEAGVHLEVQGESMGSLEGRRAAAALRQLFGAQETVAVQMGTVSRVVGVEDRAFGELIWIVRTPGAPVTEVHKIFMALEREQDAWRITQIRILR